MLGSIKDYLVNFSFPSCGTATHHFAIFSIVLALWALSVAVILRLIESGPIAQITKYTFKIIDLKIIKLELKCEISYLILIVMVGVWGFLVQILTFIQIIFKNGVQMLVPYGDLLLVCSMEILTLLVLILFMTASFIIHQNFLEKKAVEKALKLIS